MNINKLKEIVMKYVFLFTAIISIVAVVLICVFLFANGVPAMKEIGFANSEEQNGNPATAYMVSSR